MEEVGAQLIIAHRGRVSECKHDGGTMERESLVIGNILRRAADSISGWMDKTRCCTCGEKGEGTAGSGCRRGRQALLPGLG